MGLLHSSSTYNDKASNESIDSSLTLSRITFFFSGIFALVAVVVPIIFSEYAGGWTKKYTSPRPIFSYESLANKGDYLAGKVVIVTGANTGIGYYTALEMARHGANVIVAARSERKGYKAVDTMMHNIMKATKPGQTPGIIQYKQLDLASLESIKHFVDDFQKLHLPLHKLILNADIMKSPRTYFIGKQMSYGYTVTKDGFEAHIGVNHIGHFYLVQLLRDLLIKSAPSRVISVSSMAEKAAYEGDGIRFDTWKAPVKRTEKGISEWYEDGVAYGQSKLANILFVKELATQLNGTGVTAYSCHPGIVVTKQSRYMEENQDEEFQAVGWWRNQIMAKFVFKWIGQMQFTVMDGALTQLDLAVSDTRKFVNGAYYHPIGKLIGNATHPQGSNATLQRQLWEETSRMIEEAGFGFANSTYMRNYLDN